jgi:hypothetical protein
MAPRRAFPIAGLAAALLAGAAAAAPGSLEFPVKAAFLPKFASYIAWPRAARAAAPFTICVVGEDPFGPLLDEIAAGQSVDGNPVAIRRHADASSAADCHIAYVGGSARQPVAMALQQLAAAPVLTVTDEARSAKARGMVHYVVRGGRVRFHIDDAAAARQGLAIRSQLLSLAVTVTSRGAR